MNDEPAVLTERRQRVLVITINRPDQRNAVNAAVADGIAAALDELDGDPALSVGVQEHAAVGLDHDQPQCLRQNRIQAPGIDGGAAGDDQAHG